MRPPVGAVVVGDGAAVPTRLLISLLRDLSSSPKFFNRVSVASFWPSIAFGINSRRPLISSAFRLDSSSRFFSDSFRDERTDSSSCSAVSRRSVRLFSAALSSSVSVLSWSSRAKAFSNDWSIVCLSCSSCGGVGGAMSGMIYR